MKAVAKSSSCLGWWEEIQENSSHDPVLLQSHMQFLLCMQVEKYQVKRALFRNLYSIVILKV